MPAPYLPPIKSVTTQGQQTGRAPGEHCRGVLILAHPPCLSLTALVAGALPRERAWGWRIRGVITICWSSRNVVCVPSSATQIPP